MSDLLQSPYFPWLVAVLLLLLLWLLYRFVKGRGSKLDQVLREIAFERVHDLVIPNGDDGEILIDQLLLTSQGLLILELKDVDGAVFGSDKMQDWTVISADRRYTFPNPQHGLYDRIAAVRQIVRQVPVAGRVLFLDGADFSKGMPGLVATLDQLLAEFGEKNKKAAAVKVEAFMPHWELISRRASENSSREVALRIRLATASDAPELSAIGSRVFWDAYGGTAPDDDIAAHVESYFSESAVSVEMLRPEVTYFMATEDGRCAGLVKVRDSDVPASVVAKSAVEVQQLYVSMDFQRSGVGALLLDAAVAATRLHRIDGIWLSVWTDAEWATNFYLKYGFTSQAEIPFLLASTEFIDHLMWLPVGQE